MLIILEDFRCTGYSNRWFIIAFPCVCVSVQPSFLHQQQIQPPSLCCFGCLKLPIIESSSAVVFCSKSSLLVRSFLPSMARLFANSPKQVHHITMQSSYCVIPQLNLLIKTKLATLRLLNQVAIVLLSDQNTRKSI